jgi:predicted CoA-binding protein
MMLSMTATTLWLQATVSQRQAAQLAQQAVRVLVVRVVQV